MRPLSLIFHDASLEAELVEAYTARVLELGSITRRDVGISAAVLSCAVLLSCSGRLYDRSVEAAMVVMCCLFAFVYAFAICLGRRRHLSLLCFHRLCCHLAAMGAAIVAVWHFCYADELTLERGYRYRYSYSFLSLMTDAFSSACIAVRK